MHEENHQVANDKRGSPKVGEQLYNGEAPCEYVDLDATGKPRPVEHTRPVPLGPDQFTLVDKTHLEIVVLRNKIGWVLSPNVQSVQK